MARWRMFSPDIDSGCIVLGFVRLMSGSPGVVKTSASREVVERGGGLHLHSDDFVLVLPAFTYRFPSTLA